MAGGGERRRILCAIWARARLRTSSASAQHQIDVHHVYINRHDSGDDSDIGTFNFHTGCFKRSADCSSIYRKALVNVWTAPKRASNVQASRMRLGRSLRAVPGNSISQDAHPRLKIGASCGASGGRCSEIVADLHRIVLIRDRKRRGNGRCLCFEKLTFDSLDRPSSDPPFLPLGAGPYRTFRRRTGLSWNSAIFTLRLGLAACGTGGCWREQIYDGYLGVRDVAVQLCELDDICTSTRDLGMLTYGT
jgi:hypothetical protein